MIFKVLKKVFNRSNVISEIEIAEELIDLLSNENQELMEELKSTKKSKQEIALLLTSIYLFNYKLTIKTNNLSMRSKKIEDIFYHFSFLIAEKNINFYNLNQQTNTLVDKAKAKADRLMKIYQSSSSNKKINRIQEVVKALYYDFSAENQEHGPQEMKLLLDLVIQNITLIQDYLIKVSKI
ncbi:hypothetical protein [Acetohalobium arabaticum]|uniref:Uncharacterized protein n=1 Tax=Acetohalobium arabaticum (strain ATCC 49924 / DSM 5501 / Z-7288) TaxID=574087 RepID=D9QSB1_ACEAZ|nr:hypothetical protein [Acetohalobium arabaticum]ADL11567.1 hypothetical protein Acear_0015 [Acetohalobium arabaticum DSM 5501]